MFHSANNDGPDVPGQCFCCLKRDEDVVKCIDPDCEIEIHPRCAKRCEACNQAICQNHVVIVDDEPHCSLCAPEVLAYIAEENEQRKVA